VRFGCGGAASRCGKVASRCGKVTSRCGDMRSRCGEVRYADVVLGFKRQRKREWKGIKERKGK